MMAEDNNSKCVIQINNLCKTIKGNCVINNVSMTMESGMIYGFQGKNGSGKTMLMRAICGLIVPDKGEIRIDGKLLHTDIKFPESIGVLIENPVFLPEYTGYKNLMMLAKLTGTITPDDVRTAIQRTGLDPDDKRTYRKYSLGMKQKLGIANAIMGEPKIIVLDEPINALDEEAASMLRTELMKLRDKGSLIIVACHDREELEYMSDSIFEIQDGRVIGNRQL